MDPLAARVVEHHRRHARPLPWRLEKDPYAIWVCEIMAQQTRLATVIPYWERWLGRFPTVAALAAAELDDVLALWAGLGYYARARSLHKAARVMVERHGGAVPTTLEELLALPGIGRYTAGAIASIAFGRRAAVVDGNVGRVFARVFGIEDDLRLPRTQKRLWELAESLVPDEAGAFNEGLMDLGATVCTPRAPACLACPLATLCAARQSGRQDELPVLSRKATPAEQTIEVALVRRGERLLVGRRQASGLFGGLWELPEAAAIAVIVSVGPGDPVAEHVHHLTHRTFRYVVRASRLRRGADLAPAAPYEELRWLHPDALARLGVSSATAELLEQVTKGSSWPIRTAPSRSSRRASKSSSPASASSGTPSPPTRTSARPRSARPKASPS